MLSLPSTLHTARNSGSTALNSLGNILDAIADWLSSLAGDAVDSLADTAASGTNDSTNCVCYARDEVTMETSARKWHIRKKSYPAVEVTQVTAPVAPDLLDILKQFLSFLLNFFFCKILWIVCI